MAVCILLMLSIAKASQRLLIIEAVVLGLLSIIWIFYAPKLLKKNMRKSILRARKDGKLPYTPVSQLEFTDDALIETTENSTVRVPSSDINAVGRTEESIFLYHGAMQAFILPLRCVGDQKDELEEILWEKLPHVK